VKSHSLISWQKRISPSHFLRNQASAGVSTRVEELEVKYPLFTRLIILQWYRRRGCKPTPKSCDLAKICENLRKIPENTGKNGA